MDASKLKNGLAERFREIVAQVTEANAPKIIEFYSQHLWHLQRPFVKKKERCSSCILTDAFNLVGGICKPCREYENVQPQLEASKFEIDEQEAFLLLSGGKDSAYVLDRLRRESPDLHITCVLVNTGFISPLAMKNAYSIAEKTKTDLLVVNDHIDEFKSVLRKAFLDLDGRGGYGVIDHAEGSLIFQTGMSIAGKKPLINGITHAQLNHIETGEIPENLKFPLDFWRVSEEDIQNAGLVEGTPLTTNSQLIPVITFLDYKNLGYSSFEPEFGQLIREGKANRKIWLNRFEMLDFLDSKGALDKPLEQGLARLNLKPEQVLKC